MHWAARMQLADHLTAPPMRIWLKWKKPCKNILKGTGTFISQI